MTSPDFKTNAPAGWMGDPGRGAALGRPTISPRKASAIADEFAAVLQYQDRALRLKENRPADGFKASAWEYAAQYWGEQRAALREEYKAAKAREAAPFLKITLRRVRLNSGGYDEHDTYWGFGQPLYWAADESGEYDVTFRATNRERAKEIVRRTYPNARFYN